jgi:hypothetical protein
VCWNNKSSVGCKDVEKSLGKSLSPTIDPSYALKRAMYKNYISWFEAEIPEVLSKRRPGA